MSTAQVTLPGACPFCSSQWQQISHGGPCPRVKAIEYWPDGRIKKVEFREVTQFVYNPELAKEIVSLAAFTPKPDEPTEQDCAVTASGELHCGE